MMMMPPSTFKQEFRQISLSEEEERFCIQIGSQELPRLDFYTKVSHQICDDDDDDDGSAQKAGNLVSPLPAMLLRVSEADSRTIPQLPALRATKGDGVRMEWG